MSEAADDEAAPAAARAPAAALPVLSPTMEKPQLDQYLRAAFGVDSGPFSAEQIFDASRPMNSTAWLLISQVLKLDDAQSAQLILQLSKARTAPKAPAPAPTPRERAVVSEADRNRAEWMANALPGEHTSIFGRDAAGRPLDKAGAVQQRASSWAQLLSGKQQRGTVNSDGSMASTKGGLSVDAQRKLEAKAEKKLVHDEMAALPASTLHMPKPQTEKGWLWRPDIKWAYEHRMEIPEFLTAGISEGGAVTLREGSDKAGREFMQFTNVTDARRQVLKDRYGIDFYPKFGGVQAVIGAISSKMRSLAEKEEDRQAKQAKRNELDTYTEVGDVIAAAATEDEQITAKFKAAHEEVSAKLLSVSQEMAANASSPELLLELASKVSKLQGELEALPESEVQERAALLAKFTDLRERVSKRVQQQSAPPAKQRRLAPGASIGELHTAKAPAKPLMGPIVALTQAKAAALRRAAAKMGGSSSDPVVADEAEGAQGRADARTAWDATPEDCPEAEQ